MRRIIYYREYHSGWGVAGNAKYFVLMTPLTPASDNTWELRKFMKL